MQNENRAFLPMYFASCPPALDQLLVEECEKYQLNVKRVSTGGVYFTADHFMALKFMLNTRIASRLYFKIGQFTIAQEKDIYEESSKIDWMSLLNVDDTFKIQSKLTRSIDGKRKSKFTSNIYLAQVLKDSIVDQFNKKLDKRPSVNKDDADIQILLHVYPENKESSNSERADLFLDVAGNALSNRGYRLETFAAPLRENLAAALVKFIRKSSDSKLHGTFTDMMTGSATMLIEYAYDYCAIAPTFIHLSNFFQREVKLPWIFSRQQFYKNDQQLQDKVTTYLKDLYDESNRNFDKLKYLNLTGIDISNKSLSIAKECLYNAFLDENVELIKQDSTQYTPEQTKEGLLFANPPYGIRLGEDEKLDELYHNFGENLKHSFKGSTAFIISGNMEKIKKISLRTSKKIIVWNGNLECRLVQYDLF
jgi:putative N6-adenine-specific DNA methylase